MNFKRMFYIPFKALLGYIQTESNLQRDKMKDDNPFTHRL